MLLNLNFVVLLKSFFFFFPRQTFQLELEPVWWSPHQPINAPDPPTKDCKEMILKNKKENAFFFFFFFFFINAISPFFWPPGSSALSSECLLQPQHDVRCSLWLCRTTQVAFPGESFASLSAGLSTTRRLDRFQSASVTKMSFEEEGEDERLASSNTSGLLQSYATVTWLQFFWQSLFFFFLSLNFTKWRLCGFFLFFFLEIHLCVGRFSV